MVRRVAMAFGIVLLLVGILGLLSAGGMSMGVDQPAMILGIFPVNLLHNVVHLAFGVWGIVASRSFARAKMYAQAGGVIFLVLAVCGLALPNTFGLLPNGGADVWLHALLGIVLVGVGVTAKDAIAVPAPSGAKM